MIEKNFIVIDKTRRLYDGLARYTALATTMHKSSVSSFAPDCILLFWPLAAHSCDKFNNHFFLVTAIFLGADVSLRFFKQKCRANFPPALHFAILPLIDQSCECHNAKNYTSPSKTSMLGNPFSYSTATSP